MSSAALAELPGHSRQQLCCHVGPMTSPAAVVSLHRRLECWRKAGGLEPGKVAVLVVAGSEVVVWVSAPGLGGIGSRGQLTRKYKLLML